MNDAPYQATAGYTEAKKRYDEARGVLARLRQTDITQEMAEKQLAEFASPGLYRHFKSEREGKEQWRLYLVFGFAPNVNWSAHPNLLPNVVLASLYAGPKLGKLAERSLLDTDEGFLSPICRPDDPDSPYAGPRFSVVRPLSPTHLGKLQENASFIAEAKTERDALDYIGRLLDPRRQ